MSNKTKAAQLKYIKSHPWTKTLRHIFTRCKTNKHHYHKKGIKTFLHTADLKYLWFRDSAYLLKEPSIDRIDSAGNYTLENCRYIEKALNRRRDMAITINGKTESLSHWCRVYKQCHGTVHGRLKSGWDILDALTEKPRKHWRNTLTIKEDKV